jgi:ATP phosphoribosyltransferase regulatory subunit
MADSSDLPMSRPLDHPLPAGMRDLLPEEAAARRWLSRQLLERFALYGFVVVTPPVFEFAEVLERGLGTLAPADVLRFIEPESGEVAALRPDMTPQIARIVATRLRGRPPPFRLCYEGTVLRRRSGRARKHRQIPQVGVELAGVPAPAGDLELLALAADALRASGLQHFSIDIGDAGVARALLSPLLPETQSRLSDALAHKDQSEVDAVCANASAPHREALVALPTLHGGRDALLEGVARLATTPAAGPAQRLLDLYDSAVTSGLGGHLTADLGEVRGFAYYTGMIFHAYAPGTGDAVGSGGRYDELLGRFGWALPAAGFGLDLDRLGEALRANGSEEARSVRVVVVGGADHPSLARLRAGGMVAISVADRTEALAWARAWGFSHVLDGAQWVDAKTGATIAPLMGERVDR